MLRIVFTIVFGERQGGTEEMLWTLLRGVDRDDIAPAVVFFERGSFVDEVAALGIPTHVVPTGGWGQPLRGLRAIARLVSILRAERPDLVVNWMNRTQIYGGAAAAVAGLSGRTVWWQHDLSRGTRKIDRAATLLPARAIGASSAAVARRQAAIRPRRPTFFVHPGIEEPPRLDAARAADLRRRLELDAARPVVGIAGRLQEWKHQHRFLDALALLRDRGQPVQGLVVGGAAHGIGEVFERRLRAQAGDLRLDVAFTGQVADARPYVQLMDVLVNASAFEPFGIVLVEALALAVPAVAVDAGGPPEVLDDGRAGVLVASASAGDLAAGIAGLLEDPARRRSLAERGRRRYEERFTARRMVEELTAHLHEHAGRERSPAHEAVPC